MNTGYSLTVLACCSLSVTLFFLSLNPLSFPAKRLHTVWFLFFCFLQTLLSCSLLPLLDLQQANREQSSYPCFTTREEK